MKVSRPRRGYRVKKRHRLGEDELSHIHLSGIEARRSVLVPGLSYSIFPGVLVFDPIVTKKGAIAMNHLLKVIAGVAMWSCSSVVVAGVSSALIVGNWECLSGRQYAETFTPDGKWIQHAYGLDSRVEYEGTYLVDGGELVIRYMNPRYPSTGTTKSVSTIVKLTKHSFTRSSRYGNTACQRID
jgi:hypothetical protein